MRRRDFIKAIAGLGAGWPRVAHAQQAGVEKLPKARPKIRTVLGVLRCALPARCSLHHAHPSLSMAISARMAGARNMRWRISVDTEYRIIASPKALSVKSRDVVRCTSSWWHECRARTPGRIRQ